MVEVKQFQVDSSPHIFSPVLKAKIMWLVVLALLPATAYGIYIFGEHALNIIVVSIISATISESLFCLLLKRKNTVLHGSSVVTGLLLALIIPPTVPLWIPAIGSFFAIAIAKYAFGGAGMTMFNPALVGRAFLVAAFPTIMAIYAWPDGITSATPLTLLKHEGYDSAIATFGSKLLAYKTLFIGNHLGSIGETSVLALLIGGLFLMLMKIIDWKVPVIYIGTVFILTLVAGEDPLYHILAGGLFIGAFFMATGYEEMPMTKMGRIYFAIGCGILTVAIRLFGSYPEGVNYSILIMNAASPLTERLTALYPFGAKK